MCITCEVWHLIGSDDLLLINHVHAMLRIDILNFLHGAGKFWKSFYLHFDYNDKFQTIDCTFNTLRLRQNSRHFPDDIFKRIFLTQMFEFWLISLEFVPKGPVNNIPALVQIMAWRRPSDKPLSEAMLVSLLTPICVTRPQWVKSVLH